jgi:hypothetical protein
MNKKFRATSIRLMRFLYGLGFDKESEFIDGKETWLFEKSDELFESLDFFFDMRNKLRSKKNKTGVNNNEKRSV